MLDTDLLEIVCDEMFLLMDTARHNGFERTEDEIADHVADCDICSN